MIRRAILALGSNLGDSPKCFQWAIFELDGNPDILLTSCSQWRWTRPEGDVCQPNFLNGAILLRTSLSAHRLLKTMLDLAELGINSHISAQKKILGSVLSG